MCVRAWWRRVEGPCAEVVVVQTGRKSAYEVAQAEKWRRWNKKSEQIVGAIAEAHIWTGRRK